MNTTLTARPGDAPAPPAATRNRWTAGPLPLIVIAVIGAAIGFLGASSNRNELLFKEATTQELPYYFLGRAVADGPRPTEPIGRVTAPAYAMLLGASHLVEKNAAPARTFQLILLGALLPLLAAWAAGRMFGRTAGIVAGVLALLSGPFWVHAGTLQPQAWQAVIALLIVGIAARSPAVMAGSRRTASRSFKQGAVRAGSGIGRSLAIGVLIAAARLFGAAWAPFLAVTWFVTEIVRRRPLAGLAVLAGSALLLAAPLLNKIGKTPVASPPLMDGGFEMAFGFHDGATGIEPRRTERSAWRWMTARDLELELERKDHKVFTLQQGSKIWYGRTIGWMFSHPVQAVGLLLAKGWYLLSGYDPPSPESIVFRARRVLPWARFLLYGTALWVGLGLAGLWAAMRRRRDPEAPPAEIAPDVAPIVALGIATLLCGMLYYVHSGDRLPLLLALTGPAAWLLLRARLRPMLVGVALALTLVAALPWVTMARRAESTSEDTFLVAGMMERLGKTADSLAELEKTLRIDPTHVAAHLGLGGGLARDGLYDQAIEEGRKTVELQPQLSAGWRLLAMLYQRAQRFEEAADAYRKMVAIEPLNPEIHNNLGTIYAALDRYDDAVASLTQALAIDPNYRSARVNLTEIEKRGREGLKGAMPQAGGTPSAGSPSVLDQGIAAAMQSIQSGDLAGAEARLSELRSNFGATPELDFASGTLAMQKNEIEKAIEYYERARLKLSNNPYLLNNLGTAYARANRMQDAIATWEQVLQIDPSNERVKQNLEAARARQGQ